MFAALIREQGEVAGGGAWRPPELDGRQHGLEIIGRLASDAGVAGGPRTGWVVWARIDWPARPADRARRR